MTRTPSSPAVDGVRQYLTALRSDNPRDAYHLLSNDARKALSYEQFARQWKTTSQERSWQRDALEAGIKGNPHAGERARLSFSDGKVVHLRREHHAWRLETELAARSRATQPRDAIRLFAQAIAQRDIGATMDMLTQRRRIELASPILGFIAGLGQRIDDRLDRFGTDRAELRWDDAGFRYRIMLRKEGQEWRIDDIYIRPSLKTEAEPSPQGSEGAVHDGREPFK